ncbi:MAG TPA: hypothetical protein VE983_03505, partial [Solirubrobacteraceae bacterium]|nr:hypothetical protein [Solirubrobacteraceae bacterium]
MLGAALVATSLAIVVPLAAGQSAGNRTQLVAGATGSGQSGLHVVPFPNTPDASPLSQIIFSSLKLSDLAGKPTVTGSTTGVHRGKLSALPDDAGVVFTPQQPFAAGETVTVQAALTSVQAGTRSGDPGSSSLSWSFIVAVSPPASGGSSGGSGPSQAPYAPAGVAPASASSSSNPTSPHMTFRSAPWLRPPALHVSAGPAPGSQDFFVTPLPGHHRGLMILNPRGQLLWFHPVKHGLASLLAVQKYLGHRVLTYGVGQPVSGHDVGVVDHILDTSYRPVAEVRAGWGYSADLHEFQLAPHGIALIDSYVPVQTDLSSVGGPT